MKLLHILENKMNMRIGSHIISLTIQHHSPSPSQATLVGLGQALPPHRPTWFRWARPSPLIGCPGRTGPGRAFCPHRTPKSGWAWLSALTGHSGRTGPGRPLHPHRLSWSGWAGPSTLAGHPGQAPALTGCPGWARPGPPP